MSRDNRDRRGGHFVRRQGCVCARCDHMRRLDNKYGTKGARSDAARRAVDEQKPLNGDTDD